MNFSFRKWNNITGFVLFFIASLVYLLTMEREISFWDCGEFIVTSAKLGVPHAPGAALFQIIGAVWSIIAFGDGSKYPIAINSLSAISSGATIMFLFWTITHFTRRMFFVTKQNETVENAYSLNLSKSQVLIVLGSGIVGATVFMFSDTFWFSAVEAEVYAMASLFTSIVVWMGCKWEEESDKKRANRWFLLISFFIGLSTGIHFMVMLALPAVCYMYYAKNYKFTVKSFIVANVLTVIFFAFVYKVLFNFTMTFFGKTEIYVVNNLGMPFNSGTAVAVLIFGLVFYLALHYTRKHNWKLGNILTLSVLFMLIGFSSWIVLPVRANANPPINLNDPDTAMGLLDYFNREQYGSMPVFYGPAYTAHIADDGIEINPQTGNYNWVKTGENYIMDKNTKKYIKVSDRKDYVYGKKHKMLLPKMFANDPDVMENYAALYGFPEFSLNSGFFLDPSDPEEIRAQKRQLANQVYSELLQKKDDGKLKITDIMENADLLNIEPPSLGQQINYFLDFQLGYMGVRYFMWNFSGKQNDWEGNMEVTKGNWISGISFLDNWRLGDQSKLPAVYKENKGHNVYFMLPLLLGMLGFFVHLNRNITHWWALLSIFLLTSVGIIFYTSVKPFEPRERDYALVNSFYAFSIWIGLGVQGIYLLIKKFKKQELKPAIPAIITAICLGIPILMGFQNWDDHDRSKREGAYALAYNYLNNLDNEAILFTYGDNDTYPLWGLNETSNLRDDLKIVNYTLLHSSWNIDQSLRRTYNAPALPSALKHKDFREGTNDEIVIAGDNIKRIFAELNSLIDYEKGLSLAEVMELPAQEIQNYFAEFGYDPEGIKGFYQTMKPLEQFIVRDSMTAKEAIDFILDNSNPAKRALADYYETSPGALNFLPVSKIIIPVNKKNAIDNGIVSAKDSDKIVDYITVNITDKRLSKADFLILSMFAEYNWDRSIYFSGGGISKPSNIFWLSDYLEYNGFSYKFVPIYTKFGSQGKLGRSNTEKMYENFTRMEWANYNRKDASFSNTDRNYTNTYRNIAVRLANDFIEAGNHDRAKEVLDKVMEMIPDEPRYDYGLSTERIALAYNQIGETEKGNALLATAKKRMLDKIDFYESLPPHLKYTIGYDLAETRSDYSLMIYDEVQEYLDARDTVGAMNLFKKEYEPVRDELIKMYQDYNLSGDLSIAEKRRIDSQFRFLSELLGIADMIDSTYADTETDFLIETLSN